MAYTKPYLELIQEYQQIPDSLSGNKLAHISGPQAYLHRPDEEDEKESCLLDSDYDPTTENAYDWPDKHAGSTIDQGYTSVFVENALLRYFSDPVGSGSVISMVAGKKNRIRSSSVAFAANGSDYPRSISVLPERDVKVGDVVKVVGVVGSDTYTLNTYVSDIVGDEVPGVVDSAYAGDDNADAQAAAQSVDKIAGSDNCIQIDVDAANYDGRVDNSIDEYYTVEVIEGSVGGDFRTARLNITSASGLDNETDVAPELEGTHFEIGSRGLQIAFLKNAGASCSSVAEGEEVLPDDLLVGQTWRIHVVQDFTPATFTEGGSYTGTKDTTYVLRVVRGGAFTTDTDECPQITITTTNGADATGSTRINVTTSGDAIVVGTLGVTFTPTGDGLNYGDFYYIPVEGVKEGSMQTLVLGHNLPTEIQGLADLSLQLFIKKSWLEIPKNKTWSIPNTNWSQSQDAITINEDIEVEVSDWTVSGEEEALPLHGGKVYVKYREWLIDYIDSLESISDVEDIDTIQGQLHPDNPLKYGVYKAVSASAGNSVYFTGVEDPDDIASWTAMLKKIAGRTEIYNLVPMTNDREVQDLVVAHVNAQSGRTKAFLRACFLNSLAPTDKVVANENHTSDGEVILATVSDNTDVTGNQYTIVTVTSGNIDLVTDTALAAGDKIRYFYESDGFGNESYTEFVIDEIINEITFKLLSGPDVPVSVGQRIEFYRSQTSAQVANSYGDISASFSNNRVVHVWPDEFIDGDSTVPGYYLCAILAGMRSSVAPHRPMTNVELVGVTDVPRSYEFMDEEDLDTMAEKGTWIVTKDPVSGTIYNRHALTTSTIDVNRREESVRCNADAVGLALFNRVKIYIGRANVTPSLEELIYGQIKGELESLKSNEPTPEIGPSVISGEIREIKRHETQKDKMIIKVFTELPAPFNYGELHQIII